MSKLLKRRAVSLPEIKNQQGRKSDETCQYVYVKKAKNDRVGTESGRN